MEGDPWGDRAGRVDGLGGDWILPSPLAKGGTRELGESVKRDRTPCPKDLDTLVAQMLPELHTYINREIQRAQRPAEDTITTVILAGKPEFAPLPLPTPRSLLGESAITIENPPEQVFLTTLEWQYMRDRTVRLQKYHWLFFVPAGDNWQLAMMFSRTGAYPEDGVISPPQDTSYGATAQAVRTWLRDCQARY
ncbi:MAG: hypothetical protein HC925_07675 [Coleofasciculaceae cyanobacterium SM2_3_26]|nr:hypothetical protein [Coleofasciculaceae cyanobacterium SM2_3_26]